MGGEQRTAAAVQGFLNELAGGAPAEPVVRELLSGSAGRLHLLYSTLLFQSYSRLTRPLLNLQAEEVLSSVVERLLKAMREGEGGVRPQTVRQFFGLANRHMHWELNDMARRLDEQSVALGLHESDRPPPVVLELGQPLVVAQGLEDRGLAGDCRRSP